MRLDAAVPAHQGHVRQALRVVQAREHLHTSQLVTVRIHQGHVRQALRVVQAREHLHTTQLLIVPVDVKNAGVVELKPEPKEPQLFALAEPEPKCVQFPIPKSDLGLDPT